MEKKTCAFAGREGISMSEIIDGQRLLVHLPGDGRINLCLWTPAERCRHLTLPPAHASALTLRLLKHLHEEPQEARS